jgi:hypothetical protein
MKKPRRNLAVAAGSALALAMLFLFSEGSPPVTDDPFAEDTLAHDVLSAHGDSVIPMEKPVETTLAERVGEPLPPEPSVPEISMVPPSMAPVIVSPGIPPRAQERRAQSPAQQQVIPVAMTASRTAPAPARNEAPNRMGTISAGADISVIAAERVCLDGSGVGDTFSAVVVNPVVGKGGLVIPRGARAIAKITSRGDWGAGLGVRITSVRFDGRSHPVSSDVGYVTAERARGNADVCIPRRGRIDTSLDRPLRAAVSSPDA